MSMVERVLKALVAAGNLGAQEEDARAAIEAMREPTLAVMNGGWRAMPEHVAAEVEMTAVWKGAIDAALAEAG